MSTYKSVNTKLIPSNIMDLRDEAFYDFIRQFSGKKVAELLSFQECNGVDSFLGCDDVTAVLQLKSDQLNELKKSTCITLSDGSVVLLPGLESSIINLKKVLKKKREEIIKQAERLHAINSSISLPTNSTLIIPTQNDSSMFHPSTHTPSPSHASTLPDSFTVSSSNSRTTLKPLADDITNRISQTIIDWLNKNQYELNLVNTNFKEGVDFRLQLNKQQDGIMMICKCGAKNSIGQKQGILVVRNRFI